MSESARCQRQRVVLSRAKCLAISLAIDAIHSGYPSRAFVRARARARVQSLQRSIYRVLGIVRTTLDPLTLYFLDPSAVDAGQLCVPCDHCSSLNVSEIRHRRKLSARRGKTEVRGTVGNKDDGRNGMQTF